MKAQELLLELLSSQPRVPHRRFVQGLLPHIPQVFEDVADDETFARPQQMAQKDGALALVGPDLDEVAVHPAFSLEQVDTHQESGIHGQEPPGHVVQATDVVVRCAERPERREVQCAHTGAWYRWRQRAGCLTRGSRAAICVAGHKRR